MQYFQVRLCQIAILITPKIYENIQLITLCLGLKFSSIRNLNINEAFLTKIFRKQPFLNLIREINLKSSCLVLKIVFFPTASFVWIFMKILLLQASIGHFEHTPRSHHLRGSGREPS